MSSVIYMHSILKLSGVWQIQIIGSALNILNAFIEWHPILEGLDLKTR